MPRDLRVVFINYEEAQKLLPIFRYFVKYGPLKEIRLDAAKIREELELVRPIDYTPLEGRQIFLTERQHEFLLDAMANIDRG